jgi:alkyldihydroxyacetonephosphate synthase
MRRWNGWGEETIRIPLPENAHTFLAEKVGRASPLPDAGLPEILPRIPESRLPDHPLVHKSPIERLRHARGQSVADWLALRSGQIGIFPDGVAYPVSNYEVRNLLRYAAARGAFVIPYGGGTSVVGHITPQAGAQPVLTLDMGRLNRLLDLDRRSLLATFGAGAAGPDLEAQLRAHGCTLGHFPQSFEFSTLGGWVATRSCGQQSLRYGRMEQIFAGGRLETPAGALEIPVFPASAAGPDLREMVLGSEGRLGVLTEVRVRIAPLPAEETFRALFFPDWHTGVEAVRRIVQERVPLSLMRLSNSAETQTQLILGGHPRQVIWLDKWLARRGAGPEKCMLVFGVSGSREQCRSTLKELQRILKPAVGRPFGNHLGRRWRKNRFRTPYLRNSLWEKGYVVDTLETAVNWSKVTSMMHAVEGALRRTLESAGERIHVFSHLSHLYPLGASIYTTYLFRAGETYSETLFRWRQLKNAASEEIVAKGGTISHQHGVGLDHVPFLYAEKGPLGMGALQELWRHFDPQGIMNPGKLLDSR